MQIRKAVAKDFKTIKALSRKYDFERNRDWKGVMKAKGNEMFVLVEDKRIVGFTGLVRNDWNETLQVLDIFVEPGLRKQGAGRKMVEFLKKRAHAMNKYRCLIAEAPALDGTDRFYRKCGFRRCGYNDRYYSNTNPMDIAVWMSYDLR